MIEQLIFTIDSGYYLAVLYVMSGLIGLCVGSFLNVVIYRLPNHMSLASPPSHCPKCGYLLHWYDNIPILSYCILGGKCRSCRTHISFRYTAVELGNMILWLLCAVVFHNNLILMGISMIVSSVCLVICFIDLEHMIIFDRFQVILLLCGAASVFVDTSYSWISKIIGFFGAGLVFYLVGAYVSKKKGQEALGGGDIKLAAVSGLLLGWQRFLLMMLISSISGSIVMLIISKKYMSEEKEEDTPGNNDPAESIPNGKIISGDVLDASAYPCDASDCTALTDERPLSAEDAVISDAGDETETTDLPYADGHPCTGQEPVGDEAVLREADDSANDIVQQILTGKPKEKEAPMLPFAPYLTAGLIIALLFGEAIVGAYSSLLLG